MASIFRGNDGIGIDEESRHHDQEKCHFCGRLQATAFWQCASGHMAVCYNCAVRVLPALIADAMRGGYGTTGGRNGAMLYTTRDRMLNAFWRAAAIALAHDPETAERTKLKDRHIMELIDQEIAGDPAAD
jgi:hypothetical protein